MQVPSPRGVAVIDGDMYPERSNPAHPGPETVIDTRKGCGMGSGEAPG